MDSFIINSLTTPQTGLTPLQSIFLAVMFIWSMLWKGIALWHATKNNDKLWFIALLILNTVGLVEIVYLFFVAKNKLTFVDLKNYIKTLDLKKTKTPLRKTK